MPGRQILSVSGQAELRRLAADCRRAANGREIRDDLRRELMRVGRRGAAEVRSAVRATPSRGQNASRGRPSLRGSIASAVEVRVRTTQRPGVIVRVHPGRMPDGQKTLPAYYEGDIRPWRHPTFGSWSRTRTGKSRAINNRPGARPFFYRTLDRLDLAQAGDRVLSDIIKRIE